MADSAGLTGNADCRECSRDAATCRPDAVRGVGLLWSTTMKIALASAFIGVVAAAAAATIPHRTSAAEPDLAAVRKATERFRDVKVALAEGYIRDPGNMCDAAEM